MRSMETKQRAVLGFGVACMLHCGDSGVTEDTNEDDTNAGTDTDSDTATETGTGTGGGHDLDRWIARATVGRIEGGVFVSEATRDFGTVSDWLGKIGLVEARFNGTNEIVVALPSSPLRRMDGGLEREVSVENLGRWGVAALDLDGDGMDEVVNYGGVRPETLLVIPGVETRDDWGPGLEHVLGYGVEGLALMPGGDAHDSGIAICYQDPTSPPDPATLVILEWDGGVLTERWSYSTESPWCGFNVIAPVGVDPVVVIAGDDSRILAIREGMSSPFATYEVTELWDGLVVADLEGDGGSMVLMDRLVEQTDTANLHEIVAVPLGQDGFGEPLTIEVESLASFNTGDVDGDGADEIVLARYGGRLEIVHLLDGELTVIERQDLGLAPNMLSWSAVPMDLTDAPFEEIVVVSHPSRVTE